MAIRAWMDGDLRLALRLLQWTQPNHREAPVISQDEEWMPQLA
tara:strand:+ start:2206 stop:2334 length:129 start_codon:yes stop_codon:yes gene_type:complete